MFPQTALSSRNQNGQRILLTETVYEINRKTPAPNTILYYYHTDINGKYLHKENEKRSMPPNKLGQTHGYIRGWVKTSKNGKYAIYTVRPGTYPNCKEQGLEALNRNYLQVILFSIKL